MLFCVAGNGKRSEGTLGDRERDSRMSLQRILRGFGEYSNEEDDQNRFPPEPELSNYVDDVLSQPQPDLTYLQKENRKQKSVLRKLVSAWINISWIWRKYIQSNFPFILNTYSMSVFSLGLHFLSEKSSLPKSVNLFCLFSVHNTQIKTESTESPKLKYKKRESAMDRIHIKLMFSIKFKHQLLSYGQKLSNFNQHLLKDSSSSSWPLSLWWSAMLFVDKVLPVQLFALTTHFSWLVTVICWVKCTRVVLLIRECFCSSLSQRTEKKIIWINRSKKAIFGHALLISDF